MKLNVFKTKKKRSFAEKMNGIKSPITILVTPSVGYGKDAPVTYDVCLMQGGAYSYWSSSINQETGNREEFFSIKDAYKSGAREVLDWMKQHNAYAFTDTPRFEFVPNKDDREKVTNRHDKRLDKFIQQKDMYLVPKFMKVEGDLQENDLVTLTSTDGFIVPLVRIVDNGYAIELSHSIENLPRGVIPVNELASCGWNIDEVYRRDDSVLTFDYVPREEELSHDRAPKIGSLASIYYAHDVAAQTVAYWEHRMSLGDPLLDDWMTEDYKAAKETQKALETMITLRKS